MTIYESIRARRKSLKMTQQNLADAIGLSRPSMVNIESGRQTITLESLDKIALALGTTTIDLLQGVANPVALPDEIPEAEEVCAPPPVSMRLIVMEASGTDLQIQEFLRSVAGILGIGETAESDTHG